MSPDEPRHFDGEITLLNLQQYQSRRWATRARPWVDRLASAWLIKRFIEPSSSITVAGLPQTAGRCVGVLIFDGGRLPMPQVRSRLKCCWPALAVPSLCLERLGTPQCIDVGGVQPVEVAGIRANPVGIARQYCR